MTSIILNLLELTMMKYLQPERGQKGKHRTTQRVTYMVLRGKQNTCLASRPVFSGLPNTNSIITEDSSPLQFFYLVFNTRNLTVVQNGRNGYAEQTVKRNRKAC